MGDVAGHDERAAQVQARFDRIFGEDFAHLVHALIQVDVHGGRHGGGLFGQEAGRVLLELFEEDALFGNFGFDVAVGRAAYADADGARRRVARSADHPHVVYEVFAAELGADTALPADLEDFLFPLQVAEAASSFVTRGGQLVEVTCRSLLDGRQTHFGRRAADADGQVVGRAG